MILEAAKTLLREWTMLSTEWSEVTITVKKDKEGKIIGLGNTAKIVSINPEWLGYSMNYYLQLDPVKPVIRRTSDGDVHCDYTHPEENA